MKKSSTVIEDISALGPELSEEQLGLVSGGVLAKDPSRSSLVYNVEDGWCGTDADF
ncbi:putative ATP-grasp target RiPP [Streptomyces sp. WSLK1-3]|uniref:putative ATP-grasp target RiPP n=1 Tax=Streptomyces sp. WSLK1-3 TaxID=3375475 RepID=UPI0037BBA8E6